MKESEELEWLVAEYYVLWAQALRQKKSELKDHIEVKDPNDEEQCKEMFEMHLAKAQLPLGKICTIAGGFAKRRPTTSIRKAHACKARYEELFLRKNPQRS